MKRIILVLSVVFLLVSCGHRKVGKSANHQQLTIDALLKTTPVKDQKNSTLCWAYAMLATIETEHLMQGDSVNLSTDYVARRLIEEEASELYLTDRGSMSLRGVSTMLLRLINTYGLTHHDAFHASPSTDYNVICRKVEQMAHGKTSLRDFNNSLKQLLDREICARGQRVYMLGAVYTPLEFAHSVCSDNEYKAYTSFTHHPFGEPFALEVPDNRYHDTFFNVPIDTLMNIIENHITTGHPVCWEGDVSEPGFSFESGKAKLSGPVNGDVQEERQREFEHHLTTDDHCMEIVGLAHNSHGKKYFIMKNSWGTGNPYHGFMLVSYDYVRLKTIAIVAKSKR